MDSPRVSDIMASPNFEYLNNSVDYQSSQNDASFDHPRNDEIISNQSTPSQANSSISSISKMVSPAVSTAFLKPGDLNLPSSIVGDSPSTPQFSSPIATPLIKAKHVSAIGMPSYNVHPSPPTPTMSSPLLTTPLFPNMKSRSVVAPRFKTTVSSPYSTTSPSSITSSSSSLPPLVPATDLSITATPPSIDKLLPSPIKTTLLKTPLDVKYGHSMSNVSLSLDTPPKMISSPPLTTPLLPRGASHTIAISSFSSLTADVDLKGHSSRRSSLTNSPSHFYAHEDHTYDQATTYGPSANDTVASLNSSMAEDRTLSHNTTVDPDHDLDAINNSIHQTVNAIAHEQAMIANEYDECTEEERIRAEICGEDLVPSEETADTRRERNYTNEDAHNASVDSLVHESVHQNSDASSESDSARSSVNSSYEAPNVDFKELSHIQRIVLEVFKARTNRNSSNTETFAKYIRSIAPAFTLDQIRIFLDNTEEADIQAAVEYLETTKFLEKFERDNAVYYREQFDRSTRQAVMASH